MQTGNVNSTSSTSSTSTTSKTSSSTMDKDAFLKLLVAQLKNQDPTQSQDPNAMIQQMTSFSNLEQLQNINTLLSGVQTQNMAMFQAQTASLIGKKVSVTSSTMNLASGKATLGLNLAADANVTVAIKNASGNVVRTLTPGSMDKGDTILSWDGKDSNGNTLADGSYTVSITAKDNAGKDVTATTTDWVTVDSVSYTSGDVVLMAGGRSFSISNVLKISA